VVALFNEFFEGFTNGGKLGDDLAELIGYLHRVHIIHIHLLVPVSIVRLFQALVADAQLQSCIPRRRHFIAFMRAHIQQETKALLPFISGVIPALKSKADQP
jgi:hypothetical protein